MSDVAYAHLDTDSRGVPVIAGTRIKVVEIALAYLAHHWDAGDIHRQHPQLSLGQIHSALAYYFDHRDEMNRQIDAEIEAVEELREQAGPSPVIAKLHRLGRSS